MGVLTEMIDTLRREAFKKLRAMQEVKKAQIENYFKERLQDISILADNATLVEALVEFDQGFTIAGRQTGGEQWKSAVAAYSPWLEHYKTEYGYYDRNGRHGRRARQPGCLSAAIYAVLCAWR